MVFVPLTRSACRFTVADSAGVRLFLGCFMKHVRFLGVLLFPSLFLACLCAAGAADSPKDDANKIAVESEARLRKDLQFLSNDDSEGRGIQTKGINLAAEHIARQFQQAGLKPGGPDGTYFQPFNLTTSAKAGKNNTLTLGGPQGQTIELEQGKQFAVNMLSGSGKVEAPLIFAGYGISSVSPKYDDYAGLDVKGKVVVVLTGSPRRGSRDADPFPPTVDGPAALRSKLANAEKHGAAGVLLVNVPQGNRGGDTLPRATSSLRDGDPFAVPVAFLQRAWLDRFLTGSDSTLREIEKDIDAKLQPQSRPLTGWTCTLETEVVRMKVVVKNVIGVLEGAGPLAKETVIVGAHYDHVGMGVGGRFGAFGGGIAGPGAPGGVGFPLAEMGATTIHHGADDNASGSTAVMELARRFGGRKEQKGRRMVFMTFTAEESGLLGSAYYAAHPIFPLSDTTTMINMDMVGRLQDDKLMVGGLGTAKAFGPMLDDLNKTYHFEFLKEPSGSGPSDHSSFYAKGVPVLNFFTGFHEQYHRPTDRVETINVPGMRRVVDLIESVMDEARTMPRPSLVKTGPYDRTRTLWSLAPSTGVVIDHTDTKPGVAVGSIIAGTPAAKAGIKKGDRITGIAGKPVPDVATFLAVTRALKLGEKVEFAVEREGKSEKVALTPSLPPQGQPDRRFGWIVDQFADLKEGLPLLEVSADSPAGKAGLKKDDRVTAINGESLPDVGAYAALVQKIQPGDSVSVTATRGGKPVSFTVEAGDVVPVRSPAGRLGLVPDANDDGVGVLVRTVRADSPADSAGLKAGDRITAINGKALKSSRDYVEAVRGVADGDKLELTIQRGGKEEKMTMVIK